LKTNSLLHEIDSHDSFVYNSMI